MCRNCIQLVFYSNKIKAYYNLFLHGFLVLLSMSVLIILKIVWSWEFAPKAWKSHNNVLVKKCINPAYRFEYPWCMYVYIWITVTSGLVYCSLLFELPKTHTYIFCSYVFIFYCWNQTATANPCISLTFPFILDCALLPAALSRSVLLQIVRKRD